ncbi:hypothetical protein [Chryseobacterium sp. ERMR1:04]|uniref:hypothetical protein n=1 Tax=Chryseobacterium sp. ERMR1:04 TaxID=1705393 RepID=UPI0006C83E26|nr:hypothetical protein [Chryseobacterium sp. ERMR1:04]KPH14702.1 hypothetical protein AMQ68_04430 [Chryseobacterium sp. ERMR1:04]
MGRIIIDLNNPKSKYFITQNKEIVNKYLSGIQDVNIVNRLINKVIHDELILYVEEGFMYLSLCKTNYNTVSQNTFVELQNNTLLPRFLQYSENMYVNFDYENDIFINSELGENYLKNNIPCLVHLDKDIIIFYVLDEDDESFIIPQ